MRWIMTGLAGMSGLALAAGVAWGVGQAQTTPEPTPTPPATMAPPDGGVFYRVEIMAAARYEYAGVGIPSHPVFCRLAGLIFDSRGANDPLPDSFGSSTMAQARADAAEDLAEWEARADVCYAQGEPGDVVIAGQGGRRYLGRITGDAYTLPDAFPPLTAIHTPQQNGHAYTNWEFVGPRIVPATPSAAMATPKPTRTPTLSPTPTATP